jgi:hypothetical protein
MDYRHRRALKPGRVGTDRCAAARWLAGADVRYIIYYFCWGYEMEARKPTNRLRSCSPIRLSVFKSSKFRYNEAQMMRTSENLFKNNWLRTRRFAFQRTNF